MSRPPSAPVKLFWQPGCTSCLRTKEFLQARGIAFESINVAADAGGRAELARYGVATVPVVALGERFVFAQVLADVAAFLGLDGTFDEPLPGDRLVAKLLVVLDAARRYARQIPAPALARTLPGRDRSYRELAHHIFRVVEAFLAAAAGDRLTDAALNEAPPEALRTGDDIAAYGAAVRDRLAAWWAAKPDHSGREPMATYFGSQTLHRVLERTAWHSAQHARQLIMVLERLGIEPDGRLSAADLEGLPLPDNVWDE